ncbi:MAG: PKD domain-containing protein [Planctomycetota bacterium]|nr:PKD domain-containing protein [Planctomycetota bacterium]
MTYRRPSRTFALLLLLASAGGVLSARAEGLDNEEWRVPLEVDAKDPDGDPLNFLWTQTGGPKVRIADPNAAKTWFVPTEPGEYVFEVKVDDGKDSVVGTKKIKVSRPNRTPVAVPKVLPEKAELNQRILVDGSLSKDEDGKIEQYEWRQVSGPPVTLTQDELTRREFHFDAKADGDYVFELKVFDGKVWSAPAQALCKVSAANRKPILIQPEETVEHKLPGEEPKVVEPPKAGEPPDVSRIAEGKTVKLGEEIVLDGRGCKDPLGEPMDYFWSQKLDGKAPMLRSMQDDPKFAENGRKESWASPVWRVTPTQPGVYRFQLEVTAGKGQQQRSAKSKVIVFTVVSDDEPPVAELFTATPVVEKGATVELDGSKSHDKEKSELQYIWGWSGTGLKPSNWIGRDGPKVKFVAEEEGSYGIKLIVSDGKHQSEPATTMVLVRGANRAPTVNLPESVQAIVNEPVRIEAVVEDEDQDRLTLKWSVLEPKDFKLPEEAAAQNPLIFTPPEKRVYLVQLVANDGKADSKAGQVQVHVGSEIDLAPTAIVRGPEKAVAGQEVVLSGAESQDPELKRLSYAWKQVAGPAIPAPRPGINDKEWTFTPEEKGEYKVELVVGDGVNESQPHVFKFSVAEAPSKPEVAPEVTPEVAQPAPPAERKNRVPVAAIAEPATVFAGDAAELDGSGSKDEDGDKLTYRWRVLDKTPAVDLGDRDGPKLKVTTVEQGTVRVELLVNDGKADSAPCVVQLKILRKQAEPLAQPEGPTTGSVGEELVLSGEKSRSPGGGRITEYFWLQVPESGPDAKLSERQARQARLVFRPEAPGAYAFQLVVVDENGQKSPPATWTVNVAVAAKAPQAVAKVLGEGPFALGQELVLSAEESKDPEGLALEFRWKQLDGPRQVDMKPDGAKLSVRPQQPGQYAFEVSVDNGKAKSSDRVSFEVGEGDKPPIARIAELVPVEAGDKLTLDATGSSDPEGKALEYRWKALSWPEGGEPSLGWLAYKRDNLKVKLPKAGEYEFELKVYDGKLWSEAAKAKVKTRQANVPPQASPVALAGFSAADLAGGKNLLELPHIFKHRHLITEERREVILDGSGSTDPDQGPEPLAYEWRQATGARPENVQVDGPRVRFVAARKGDMVWELIVRDGKDASQPERVQVTVVEPASLPRAIAKPNVIEAKVAQRGGSQHSNIVILDGSDSTAGEGRQLKSYEWKQVGGEDLQLRAPALAKPRVGLRIYHAGKYRFTLTVFDGEYTSLPATVDVNVTDPALDTAVTPREEKPAPRETPPEQKSTPKTETNPDSVEARDPERVTEPPPPKLTVKPEEAPPTPQDDGTLIPPPTDVKIGEKPEAKPKPKEEPAPEPVAVKPEPAKTESPSDLPKEEPLSTAQASKPKEEPVRTPEPKEEPAPPPQPVVTVRPEPEPAPEPVAQPDPVQPVVTRSKKAWDDPEFRKDDPVFQTQKRRYLATALQSGAEAERELIKGLDDRDADLRSVAAMCLVQRGFGSVPTLIAVLEQGSDTARTEARAALAELAKKDHGTDPRAWKRWWNEFLGLPVE